MIKDPQWVIAIANSIAALGVIFIIIQLFMTKKNLEFAKTSLLQSVEELKLHRESLDKAADQISLATKSYVDLHELERRKAAISSMKDWTLFIYDMGTGGKCFAEKLDFEKSKLLWNEKSFNISIQDKAYLERTVKDIGVINVFPDNEKEAVLSASQSSLIRKQVVSYLNFLETIMSARRHNVADSDILTEQFSWLVVPKEGKQLLPNFRKVAGGIEAFPSIEEFVNDVEKKKSNIIPGKSPLGK